MDYKIWGYEGSPFGRLNIGHCVLLITNPLAICQPRMKRFHFEAMWTKREDYKAIIEAAWGIGGDLSTLKVWQQT